MLKKIIHIVSFNFLILIFISCSRPNVIEIKNSKNGQLKSTVEMLQTDEKKFILDTATAPQPVYTQIYTDSSGARIFTFFNKHNHSIYFYDYQTAQFKKKINFGKARGENRHFTGYFIKSLDSIYLYNPVQVELLIANAEAEVFDNISLIGGNSIQELAWRFKYPQYLLQTAAPFLVRGNELLFPGQFIGSVPDSLIDSFKTMAYVNLKLNTVTFNHPYPKLVYGNNHNWYGHSFSAVYVDINEDKLIFSFPVSHDLYIADLKSGSYKVVYGGSNLAGTISSINAKPNSDIGEIVSAHRITSDLYTAIKYDKYRKVYYRFLTGAIENTSGQWQKKPVSVIVMDENFNYLGETTIGTMEDWYIQNVFVTKEGLNIEYIEKESEETHLILKIFTLKKLV